MAEFLLNIVEINLPRSSSVPRLCHIQYGGIIFIPYHARTETTTFTLILKLKHYAQMHQVPSLFQTSFLVPLFGRVNQNLLSFKWIFRIYHACCWCVYQHFHTYVLH